MSCFSSGLDTSRPRLISVSRTARSGSENSVPDMVDPFLSSSGEKLFQLPEHHGQVPLDLAVGEAQHRVPCQLQLDVAAPVPFIVEGTAVLVAVDLDRDALGPPHQVHPDLLGERVGAEGLVPLPPRRPGAPGEDRKSTRLNSSHVKISYA